MKGRKHFRGELSHRQALILYDILSVVLGKGIQSSQDLISLKPTVFR